MKRKEHRKKSKISNSTEKITKGLLENLIVPGLHGAANALSDEQMKKEILGALQNNNQNEENNKKYRLTPKGILFAIIETFYGNNGNTSKFEKFQKALVSHLSLIASNNTKKDMFGNDFNEFFSIIITTMNLLDRTIKMLQDNGIECDIRQMLEEDDEQY